MTVQLGKTALMRAAECGHAEMSWMLLDRHADPDATDTVSPAAQSLTLCWLDRVAPCFESIRPSVRALAEGLRVLLWNMASGLVVLRSC